MNSVNSIIKDLDLRRDADLFSPSQLPLTVKALRKTIDLAMSLSRDAHLKDGVLGKELVTQADPLCEELASKLLGLARSGEIPMVAEESTKTEYGLPHSYRTHDPIDGTNAFALGLDLWGTLFGEVANKRPENGVALFCKDDRGISICGKRREVLTWDHKLGTSEPLSKPSSFCNALLFASGYYSDLTYETILRAVEPLGLTVKTIASATDATMEFSRGEGGFLIGTGGKVWDYVPLGALMQLWGGSCLQIATGLPHTWDTVSANVVFGYNPILLSEVVRAIKGIPLEVVSPEFQWVPHGGKRIKIVK